VGERCTGTERFGMCLLESLWVRVARISDCRQGTKVRDCGACCIFKPIYFSNHAIIKAKLLSVLENNGIIQLL